jgi:hypothetical protein
MSGKFARNVGWIAAATYLSWRIDKQTSGIMICRRIQVPIDFKAAD